MLALVRTAVIVLCTLGIAPAVAFPSEEQAPPAPLEDHGRLGAQERFLGFQTCSPSMGLVHSVVVRAHDEGSTLSEGSADPSIVFRSGSVYDISIIFTSPVKAHRPRAALIASDVQPISGPDPIISMDTPVESYAYSGQSFDACRYTSCPVRAHTLSTYTYLFRTLHSKFSWLTFNVTSTARGPSLFCVGFPVTFIDEPEPENSSSEANELNTAWEPYPGDPMSDGSSRQVGGGGDPGGFEFVIQSAY